MTSTPERDPQALEALLTPGNRQRFSQGRLRLLVIAAAALVAVAVLVWLFGGDDHQGRYVTESVTRGNLVVTVSANGTLQPTTSVDVGSELSGTIDKVLVEENDQVKKGQLLAELDTAKLDDAVAKSSAALAAAQAAVAQARATVAESQATLQRMHRVAELSGGKVPAPTELEVAAANLARAEAEQGSARAAVAQARATLKTDQTNLAKATIRSPIDGVVLTRSVEPGQTVVASMSTPVLFVLAEDLTHMELQIQVDEADVGSVRPGQPATFTVSAWPNRNFPASIRRVGLGSTITDNVVTYKTILDVTNNDLALRPGMTATATIVTADRRNVLLVPNAALRFTPPQTKTASSGSSFVSRLVPRPPRTDRPRQSVKSSGTPQVWVLDDDGPRAVPVKTGVSNGRQTEILGGDLQPGTAVITDYREPAS